MKVLIPAYEPDSRLVDLVQELRVELPDADVVVIDDGSGPSYRSVFAAVESLDAEVLRHATNRGKGAALKTGFAHLLEHHPDHEVVCADCDGQHRPGDIAAVAGAVEMGGAPIVLGVRSFAGAVPARSRFGNSLTRLVFRVVTGVDILDTQTGLRAYSSQLLHWLCGVGGERFEYELEVLLAARRAGIAFTQVSIATVYHDGNGSSHFRPVRDSLRVYVPFVRFGAVSLTSFVVDATLFFGLMSSTGNLALSVAGARALSATLNYQLNRRLVFGSTGGARPARRYAALAIAVGAANYSLLWTLTNVIDLGVRPSKLLTESTLFVLSFVIQRAHVFDGESRSEPNLSRSGSSG